MILNFFFVFFIYGKLNMNKTLYKIVYCTNKLVNFINLNALLLLKKTNKILIR